jgi:putative oxidoreductase
MTRTFEPRSTLAGLALIRTVVGATFVAHGLQKLVVFGPSGLAAFMAQIGLPFPLVSAALITGTELLGGLALLIGLWTRWAALPLAFSMLVATVTVHLPAGFFLPQGAEYTIVLLAATLGLALTGPGAYAIDNLRQRVPATEPEALRKAA